MLIRADSVPLASRPARQLVDLWMVVTLFAAVKGIQGGIDREAMWGFASLAFLLAAVWWIGRPSSVRRFFGIVLGQGADATAGCEQLHLHLPEAPPSSCGIANDSALRNSLWAAAGFVVVVSLLAFLQWRQPNYFVQDDNLSQFLPVVLQGCRSLFDDGVLPTWNPHQFLGSPTTTLGTYALTYPPTYVSYAVSRWVLGNEFAALDVFCIGHLLAGYVAAFWACRVLGIRASLAAFAGVCFALSGFFLIAGRSWYYMTPTATWMPLLLGLMEKLRRGNVGWKWCLATGGVLGALFHAGNAQMWCYALLFYAICLAIWLACRAVSRSQALMAVAAGLLGLAIAMPLLLPQYLETRKLGRYAGDTKLLPYLPAIFFPYPLGTADYPGVTETPDLEHMGHLYYGGTLFSVVAAAGMLSILALRWDRETVAANVWLVLAWVALVCALGRVGGLWYFLGKVPPFTGFKHAFKFIPFATLFMMVGGALLIERAWRCWRVPASWVAGLVATVTLLMSYHVWMATPSFCDYAFRPFPELPAEMQAIQQGRAPARVYSIGPRRSQAAEFGLSMMHQLPTVWGWYAFEGYDPLVRCSPRFGAVMEKLFAPAAVSGMQMELGPVELGLDEFVAGQGDKQVNHALRRTGMDEHGFWGRSFRIDLPHALAALRAYGVRWVVMYAGPQKPRIAEGNPNEIFWCTDPVAQQVGEAVKERGRLVVHRPEVCIFELPGAAPLAFAVGKARHGLPIEFDGGGLTVDTRALADGGDVVVNVVEAPSLKADIDGQQIQPTTDKWGRLVFRVPSGAQRLSVHYSPSWLAGILVGAILAIAAAGIIRRGNRTASVAARLVAPQHTMMPLPLRRAA